MSLLTELSEWAIDCLVYKYHAPTELRKDLSLCLRAFVAGNYLHYEKKYGLLSEFFSGHGILAECATRNHFNGHSARRNSSGNSS